jgi:hypothetical protein
VNDVRLFLCEQFGKIAVHTVLGNPVPFREGACTLDIQVGNTHDGRVGESFDAAKMKFGNLSCSDDADLELPC